MLNHSKRIFLARISRWNPFWFFLLAIWFSPGCDPQKTGNTEVSWIHGYLVSPGNKQIFLYELDVTETRPVDSARLQNDGSFSFALLPEGTGFYQIIPGGNAPLTLIVSPGERITLKGSPDSLIFADIQGSDESILLQTYLREAYQSRQKAEALGRWLASNQNHPRFPALRDSVVSVFDSLYLTHRSFVKKFIRTHPTSLSSIIALNQKFGNKTVVSEESDRDLFLLLDSHLIQRYPDNKHALHHRHRMAELARIEAARKLAREALRPGNPVPYFRLPSPEEEKWISPDLYKDKIWILVFWSPEVAQNLPLVRKLKTKVLQSGERLEVLAVSMGTNTELWKAAIQAEGLSKWNHASDLKGYRSPMVELFTLQDSLPRFFLMGRDGKIKRESADPDSLFMKIPE